MSNNINLNVRPMVQNAVARSAAPATGGLLTITGQSAAPQTARSFTVGSSPDFFRQMLSMFQQIIQMMQQFMGGQTAPAPQASLGSGAAAGTGATVAPGTGAVAGGIYDNAIPLPAVPGAPVAADATGAGAAVPTGSVVAPAPAVPGVVTPVATPPVAADATGGAGTGAVQCPPTGAQPPAQDKPPVAGYPPAQPPAQDKPPAAGYPPAQPPAQDKPPAAGYPPAQPPAQDKPPAAGYPPAQPPAQDKPPAGGGLYGPPSGGGTQQPPGNSTGGAGTGGTPGTPANVQQQADQAIQNSPVDRNINFKQLPKDTPTVDDPTRDQMGLDDDNRAVVHLYGRQVITAGVQNGDIYHTVLDPAKANDFTPVEKQFVHNWADAELAQAGVPAEQRFLADGSINPAVRTLINGTQLDAAFFNFMDSLGNKPAGSTAAQFANRQVHNSTGQPLNIINDLNQIEQNTGLNQFEQAVLRLWGHDPLTNGGTIDGSILAYTIGNPNALDSNANSGGNGIDAQARALLEDDFIVDGNMNGGSLRDNFTMVLEKIYQTDVNGDGLTTGTNEQISRERAMQAAQANGRTIQQIGQDLTTGVQNAMDNVANIVRNHPAASIAAVGGLAAATAICPFLGGLGAGAAAVGLGSQMLNNNNAAAQTA